MKLHESPFCFDCPIWSQISRDPEAVYPREIQKVGKYMNTFLDYRDNYIDSHVEVDAELRETLGRNYVSAGNPCAADNEFISTAAETKWRILADLNQRSNPIPTATARVIGQCARQLVAGTCANSGVMPGYAAKLADMRARGLVD